MFGHLLSLRGFLAVALCRSSMPRRLKNSPAEKCLGLRFSLMFGAESGLSWQFLSKNTLKPLRSKRK